MGIPESPGYGRQLPPMSQHEAQQWAMYIHMSSLLGFVGIPSFLGPLILWMMKKDQSPFVDLHGKEALNFQLSMILWTLIALVACLVLIGFVAVPVLLIIDVVCSIQGGMRANEGHHYQYPLTIRFIQ